MNLFSPSRPQTLTLKPAWEREQITISPLELTLNSPEILTISIWLPIKGENFGCMRFEKQTKASNLPQILKTFTLDPETFCETFFQNLYFSPQLRTKTKLNLDEIQEEVPNPNTNINTPKRPYSRQRYKKSISKTLDF